MRVYRDKQFTGRVADFAQDHLDDHMVGIPPISIPPTPGSNLGRAGMACSRRAQHLLEAMHDVDRAYWQIGAVKLPDDASRDLERRLDRTMNDLADLSEELSVLWRREAESIWMNTPFGSRVERLQALLADLREWKDDAGVRVRLIDLLRFRSEIDPEAAEAAGVEADGNAKMALNCWPFPDASFRSTAESAPCSG